jgi:trehalose 6-phosphate phosphatase
LIEAVRPLTRDPGRAAILCDIDGTLAPIVSRPEEARVPEDVAKLLEELGRRYACVACVTGRPAAEARRLAGADTIVYAGLHGAEWLEPGQDRPRLAPALEPWRERVQRFSSEQDSDEVRGLGIRIEDKGPIAAWHWRGAVDDDAAVARLREIAHEAQGAGLATHWGRKVLEVRPPVPVGKGEAVRALVKESGARAALFAGDDTTDLDAFDALEALASEGVLEAGVRVGVRSEEGPDAIVQRADLVVDGVHGLKHVLEHLRDA